jgi:hypothetical protein
MKNTVYLLIVCILSSCTSVNFDENLFGSYLIDSTRDITQSETGVVAMKATARNSSKEKALELAKKYAVAAVLFKGIPNSSVQKPLLSSNISDQTKAHFTKFFNEGVYLRFVQRAIVDYNHTYKIKGGYEVNADVAVQYELLKEYLKENNLKTKFGI